MVEHIRAQSAAIPTPLAGLALGIGSLSWILDTLLDAGGGLQGVGAAVALFLQTAVGIKFLSQPARLLEELEHPVTGSILPTLPMGLMVVSKSLEQGAPGASLLLWSGSVILHVLLLLGFVISRFSVRDWERMLPSWFIPFVGVATAALTAPTGQFLVVTQGIILFGLGCFALLLPPIIHRLVVHPTALPEAARPTMTILAAPASLLLAGYVSVFPSPSPIVCGILLGIALLLTAVVYMMLVSLLRMPFTPAFAALTFPLVIGATALARLTASFEPISPEGSSLIRVLHGLCFLEVCVASLVVGYVILLYLLHYLQGTALAKIICGWLTGTRYDSCIFCTTKP